MTAAVDWWRRRSGKRWSGNNSSGGGWRPLLSYPHQPCSQAAAAATTALALWHCPRQAAAVMPLPPPNYHHCHRRHASLTLPSCYCRRKAVAATATAATATTAVALSRHRHCRRHRAPDAAQLLLPSCCRRRHHRVEPAPQCFRRRCQAAVTANAATFSPLGAVECEAPFMNKEGNQVGAKKSMYSYY
jgi:hypothetical protein